MDPVTFSIIRHRLFRVVEEAVITLKHVSGSAITNEGHDLMVSLYQADGSLLMGGRWLSAPPHQRGGSLQGHHPQVRRPDRRGRSIPAQRPVHRGFAYL